MSVELRESRPNNTAKIQEGLLIDLISAKQFGVIAKVAKKPGELPKCTLCAIQPTCERNSLKSSWLQNAEPNGKERLMGMPLVGSSFDTDQEDTIQIGRRRVMPRVQARKKAPHGLASAG
jgi:hypothetical protein